MLHINKMLILALLFTLFSSPAIKAQSAPSLSAEHQPDIKVASMEIPQAYEKNGTGVYNEIFNKLIQGYAGKIDVSFYPSARYNRVMINRQADCDYVATDNTNRWQDHGITDKDLVFIGPVNKLYVVLYTPIDAPDITTIDQIKGLILASDVNLTKFIHSLGIKETFALQSQPQMLRMLAAGRINGLIGYDFDLDLLSKQLGLTSDMKKASIRLQTITDGITCFNTPKTAAFRKHLKKNFAEMKSSGWLADKLKDY